MDEHEVHKVVAVQVRGGSISNLGGGHNSSRALFIKLKGQFLKIKTHFFIDCKILGCPQCPRFLRLWSDLFLEQKATTGLKIFKKFKIINWLFFYWSGDENITTVEQKGKGFDSWSRLTTFGDGKKSGGKSFSKMVSNIFGGGGLGGLAGLTRREEKSKRKVRWKFMC